MTVWFVCALVETCFLFEGVYCGNQIRIACGQSRIGRNRQKGIGGTEPNGNGARNRDLRKALPTEDRRSLEKREGIAQVCREIGGSNQLRQRRNLDSQFC